MKKIKVLPLILLLGIGLTACASSATSSESGTLDDLTLQVGDQIAGTEKILQAAGELEDVPYQITWSSFTSGPPQIEALNAGKIDYAITGNTPPVLSGDTDTKVIQAFTNNAEGDAILVRPDSDITSVVDLSGRSIAVARGSSAHGHLILQLQKAGVDIEDVEINYLPPTDSKNAFEAGQVDAWAVWDPYTAIAESDGAIPLVTGTGVTNGFGFGIASEIALGDEVRAEALRDLTQRVARAYHWAAENPGEWAKVYAEETGTDIEVAKLHTRSQRVPVPLDDSVTDSQNDLIAAFTSTGVLPRGFDFADQTDTRFNDVLAPYFEE